MDEEIQNMYAEAARETEALQNEHRIRENLQNNAGADNRFDSGAGGPKNRFKPDADDRSVCVLGLPVNTEVNDLGTFFSDCGPIAKITKLMDKRTNSFKGMAYIEFETHEGAGRAVDQKNGAAIPGPNGPVNIKVAKKRSLFRPGGPAAGGPIAAGAGRGRGGALGGRGGYGGGPAASASSNNDMAAMAATMMAMMLQTQQQMMGGAGIPGLGGMGGMLGGRGGGLMGARGGAAGFGGRGSGMGGRGGGGGGFGPRGGFGGGNPMNNNNNNMNGGGNNNNNGPQSGGNPFG